jgi:hypothetical protein
LRGSTQRLLNVPSAVDPPRRGRPAPHSAGTRLRLGLAALTVACAATAFAAPAASALSSTASNASRGAPVSDGGTQPAVTAPAPFSLQQHANGFDHLLPTSKNVDLIGKLNLIDPATGVPVLPGQIADVAVHKGYAYLNSWDSPTCEGGGTYVVDIRDPAHPKQIAFIPAVAPFYHGEGAQVISVSTPQFTGDLLAVNDETYGSNVALTDPGDCAPADKSGGGFDLYNVTDPAHPVALVQGAGDRSPESSVVQDPSEVAKSYHSVFIWQQGPRAYLVASDNIEVSDIDIFDITDPVHPAFIKDLNLLETPQADQIVGQSAHGNAIFHHDVVVKQVAGHMRMLVSYWDAGYVQLNVDSPANPSYITDTNYDSADTLTGMDPPEGNAHEAEYSHDGQFFLAADEDFAPNRAVATIDEAPYAGFDLTAVVSDAEPIAPGTTISGDTVFVGLACTGTVPAPPAGVTVAVAERGVCSFQEKADAIQAAGYAMGVVFNNSFGGGGGRCESLINMLIDPDTVDIPMTFVPRSEGLRILNAFNPGTYACTGGETETPADTDAPATGTPGLAVSFGTVFDGWGYAHLYDANTSQELGAYAIPESLDPRYSTGFGALSIHEFATDPETNLAYSAYYAGGLRVFSFGRTTGLQEVGNFIDQGGNDFWGVEQFTDAAGNRLIATSDRDYGLYIFKYTGPGAVLAKPAAVPPPPPPPPPPAVVPPAAKPASFFTFGALKRMTIHNRQGKATISLPGAGKVSASLKARIGRRVITLATTSRTATRRGSMRLTFRLSRTNERRLRRTLAQRNTHRTSGVVRVTFTPTGGKKRTRNKSLSIGMR